MKLKKKLSGLLTTVAWLTVCVGVLCWMLFTESDSFPRRPL